jgi:predicted NodU family carbamoyl transferase
MGSAGPWQSLDPSRSREKNSKDSVNAKIKKRESCRPFAPSVLGEEVVRCFE